MNIDKIVEVNIQISEAMSIDGGYDTILIMGPLPKTPGGNSTPDVASYTNLQDLKDAGFTAEDPVYIAASKVFSQSPKPSTVMIAVQKLSSGSPEKVDATLDRTASARRASTRTFIRALLTGRKPTRNSAFAKQQASRLPLSRMQCFARLLFTLPLRATA